MALIHAQARRLAALRLRISRRIAHLRGWCFYQTTVTPAFGGFYEVAVACSMCGATDSDLRPNVAVAQAAIAALDAKAAAKRAITFRPIS